MLFRSDGVTKAAKAKFSYVYTRKPGKNHLLITTHNSGITPQGVTVIAKKKYQGAPPPPPISVDEVSAARDAWIQAVEARDVHAVVALYDTENVRLLGTVDTEDNKLRNNHHLIEEYFHHFLSNDRLVAKFPEVTEDNIIQLGPNHVIFSDFFSRLSPIQPEIGSTGVFFSTKSFFQPTFTSMLFISFAISSYRDCL